MLSRFLHGIRKSKQLHDVLMTLATDYSLHADLELVSNYMHTFELISMNKHELAMGYVADQIMKMDSANQTHISWCQRYVLAADRANKSGVIRYPDLYRELLNIARSHMGVEIS